MATEKAIELFKGDIDLAVICSPDHMDPTIFCWRQYLEKKLNCKVIDLSGQHHLQHASLAFYNSGFEKSLILVIDRNGSRYGNYRESETVFVAEYPCKFAPVIKNMWRDSEIVDQYEISEITKGLDFCEINLNSRYGIVKVYETATSLIQQHALENGKTMGLAAYGKDRQFESLFKDQFFPVDDLFSHCYLKDENAAVHKFLQKDSIETVTQNNFQFYADYAYHVQKSTEAAAISLIRKSISKTGIKNICITGGYALNVVANSMYLSEFPDCNFYFEPLADDSGNSIGGAMLMYRDITKDTNITPLTHTFINSINYDLFDIKGKSCTISDIVQFLIAQSSVGIYQGKAEAGPRALGNRSILFDSRNPNAKNIVNRIKKREWYRPFAAMILKDKADDFFQMSNNVNNKFMTVSYKVRDSKKHLIPGVIHVDDSCRLQTVDANDGIIYQILQEFEKQTGIPVLLNTSLNLAGQPLVETPAEALDVLNNTELDMLYFPEMNSYVNRKKH